MRTGQTGVPPDLDGLDPAWSREVHAVDSLGVPRTWHVLDNTPSLGGATPAGTLLCVHGNPTWSYTWRRLLARAAAADPPWRCIAIDHLDMGYSERTGTVRRLAQRVTDLGTLTEALELDGPIVSVGHDWGGVISLGWALKHREQLVGVAIANTAVHQPKGIGIPISMRFTRVPVLLSAVTVGTPGFILSMLALANPPLPRSVWKAYLAPYRTREQRAAVGVFVKDIPLVPSHPSWDALTDIAENLGDLSEIPVLMLWGPRDPVFRDMHLRDLQHRLPHASLHRFERAGHLVVEDADVAGAVMTWVAELGHPSATAERAQDTGAPERERRPLWAALEERAGDQGPAIVEPARADGTAARTVTWASLARQVEHTAAGLADSGVRNGDRVALLIPPGPDLAVTIYACLRIGAVIVVADAGLGLPGLHRALRSAAPQFIVGIDRGLAAAQLLRWTGKRIATGRDNGLRRRLLSAPLTLSDLARRGAGKPLPTPPGPDQEAAVLFTSGSTGPAKGVVYTHRQLEAARDLLLATYDVKGGERLVAAFAPFALFGPALGATSAVPDMDVTAPATLTAAALADAVASVDATYVFSAPAALVNVTRTAGELNEKQRAALRGVRLLLSAGAPVSVSLLASLADLMPNATAHTPYGMTEALPVTDVTFGELLDAGSGNGVLVGRPLAGVDVAVSPFDQSGVPNAELTDKPDITGEIVVHAAHVMDHYDQL